MVIRKARCFCCGAQMSLSDVSYADNNIKEFLHPDCVSKFYRMTVRDREQRKKTIKEYDGFYNHQLGYWVSCEDATRHRKSGINLAAQLGIEDINIEHGASCNLQSPFKEVHGDYEEYKKESTRVAPDGSESNYGYYKSSWGDPKPLG